MIRPYNLCRNLLYKRRNNYIDNHYLLHFQVFHIRNLLAHFNVKQKLQLDDHTFGSFWKDITGLVDALESLGRQYFTQQIADELRQKIIEVCL